MPRLSLSRMANIESWVKLECYFMHQGVEILHLLTVAPAGYSIRLSKTSILHWRQFKSTSVNFLFRQRLCTTNLFAICYCAISRVTCRAQVIGPEVPRPDASCHVLYFGRCARPTTAIEMIGNAVSITDLCYPHPRFTSTYNTGQLFYCYLCFIWRGYKLHLISFSL